MKTKDEITEERRLETNTIRIAQLNYKPRDYNSTNSSFTNKIQKRKRRRRRIQKYENMNLQFD